MKSKKDGSAIFLVDKHSRLFTSIAKRLAPLESPSYLHVTYSTGAPVFVELPRMKLSFFVNADGELESNNLRNQVVDENQISGTLIGLRDQLLLRAKHSTAQSFPQSRLVLIPYGIVHFSTRGHHVLVEIETNANRQISFHQYKIDTDLQYLTTTSGLTGRLFKIYLHALTSHCLPDPLTGRTGTEEALHELAESAISSFDQIDDEQAQLLSLIGRLTPAREFYPSHLHSMQSIRWADLSPLSQHYAYCTATNLILQRANTLQLFHPLQFELATFVTARDTTLLVRSANRTHVYYPADTVASLLPVNQGLEQLDCRYAGRDFLAAEQAHDGDAATWASDLAFRRWKQPSYAACDLISMLISWAHVQGPSDDLSLTYSSHWLDFSLRSSWISIYNLCRQATTRGTRYGLGVCLASAVYSKSLSETLVQVLIAFAANPEFRRLSPPSHPSYRITDGYRPESDRVEQIVLSTALELGSSPAGKLPRSKDETMEDFKQRQRSHHDKHVSELALQLAKNLADQWPHTRPKITGNFSSWFQVKDCLEAVRKYFISCSRNAELRTHLKRVETALNSHPSLSNKHPVTDLKRSAWWQEDFEVNRDRTPDLSLQTLMEFRAVLGPTSTFTESDIRILVTKRSQASADTAPLANLLSEFRNRAANPLHNCYGMDLEKSRAALVATNVVDELPGRAILIRNQQWRQKNKQVWYKDIHNSLGPLKPAESVAFIAGIWPRCTPRILLQRLTLEKRASVPVIWCAALTQYAHLFLECQRAHSLVNLAQKNRREEFLEEFEFDNSSTAEATSNADWLLIQVS